MFSFFWSQIKIKFYKKIFVILPIYIIWAAWSPGYWLYQDEWMLIVWFLQLSIVFFLWDCANYVLTSLNKLLNFAVLSQIVVWFGDERILSDNLITSNI